jgi:NADPH:quinone reductase-like Zn-dependent oxidoreductase
MQAYEIRGTNGIDSVTKTDRDVLKPVQIKVRAVSLNFRDLLIAKGAYGSGIKSGLIPCSDGAGEVTAVGEGVTSVSVGDRVTGAFFPNWLCGNVSAEAVSTALGGSVDGMLAE